MLTAKLNGFCESSICSQQMRNAIPACRRDCLAHRHQRPEGIFARLSHVTTHVDRPVFDNRRRYLIGIDGHLPLTSVWSTLLIGLSRHCRLDLFACFAWRESTDRERAHQG